MTRITLDGGKYTVLHDNGTNLRAERYGEPWRDCTGDGLILAMAQRIEELEAHKAALEISVEGLRSQRDALLQQLKALRH